MAQKTINELQLIAAVTSSLSIPGDNGTQTYRFTAEQLKNFVLAAGNVGLSALDLAAFTGLTAVAAADDDYLVTIDTSDSNKTKKILVSTFSRNAYRAVSSFPDTVLASDSTLKLSGASGTLTLLSAVGIAGKRIKIIHGGTSLTQVYTIGTTSGQTIGGIAGGSYALYTNGEVLEVESNGANWEIVNHHAVTPWTSYTLVAGVDFKATTTDPTFATVTTVKKGYWMRRGQNMHVRFEYGIGSAAGSSNGSGDYLFVVPAGQSMDTTLMTPFTGSSNQITSGFGHAILRNTNGHLMGSMVPYNATSLRIYGITVSNNLIVGSGVFPIGTTDAGYFLDYIAPILNWRP